MEIQDQMTAVRHLGFSKTLFLTNGSPRLLILDHGFKFGAKMFIDA